MSTAEGMFINREISLPRPEIDINVVGQRLAKGMKRTIEGVRKLGKTQRKDWLSRIGSGVVGEKYLADFGATLVQIDDAKRPELLTAVLEKLFPSKNRGETALLAETVSQSVSHLKQATKWEEVAREISTVANKVNVPQESYSFLTNEPPVVFAANAPTPWGRMDAVPPPPLAPRGGGGAPRPPQRNLLGWLKDAIKPTVASAKHYSRLIGCGAVVALVGGVIIVGGANIIGSVAENIPMPQIGGEATLRDRLSRTFAGYENRFDTESITYSKIIDGKPPADWNIEQQMDFLKNSDDATRVASLAALRTKLEIAGINTYVDAETYFGRYYKGTDLINILALSKYALLSGPAGFPDSHGFDSYFGISTPTPTPATSPVPTKTPAPTPRIISQEQRQNAERLTRDLKSRQNAMVRTTGSATKGF